MSLIGRDWVYLTAQTPAPPVQPPADLLLLSCCAHDGERLSLSHKHPLGWAVLILTDIDWLWFAPIWFRSFPVWIPEPLDDHQGASVLSSLGTP